MIAEGGAECNRSRIVVVSGRRQGAGGQERPFMKAFPAPAGTAANLVLLQGHGGNNGAALREEGKRRSMEDLGEGRC